MTKKIVTLVLVMLIAMPVVPAPPEDEAVFEERLRDISAEVSRFLDDLSPSERDWSNDAAQRDPGNSVPYPEGVRLRDKLLTLPPETEVELRLKDGEDAKATAKGLGTRAFSTVTHRIMAPGERFASRKFSLPIR